MRLSHEVSHAPPSLANEPRGTTRPPPTDAPLPPRPPGRHAPIPPCTSSSLVPFFFWAVESSADVLRLVPERRVPRPPGKYPTDQLLTHPPPPGVPCHILSTQRQPSGARRSTPPAPAHLSYISRYPRPASRHGRLHQSAKTPSTRATLH